MRNHPVASEVLRLWEQTGDKSAAPKSVGKSIQVNSTLIAGQSKRLDLTNEDISRLTKLQGSLTTELMRAQLASPAYYQLTDYERARVFAGHVAAAQNAAKAVLFGHKLMTLSKDGPQINAPALRAIAFGKSAGLIP